MGRNSNTPGVILFILLLTLPALRAASQQNNTLNSSVLKLNLTSAIDVLSFPTLQLSYEQPVSRSISISGEFGYQFYNLPVDNLRTDTSFITPKGFKSSFEIRHYNLYSEDKLAKTNNRNFLKDTYVGLNVFYRQNQNNVQIYYDDRNRSSTTSYTDCYWIKKRTAGFNVIYGMQKSISERMIVDLYFVAGLMHRTVDDFNIQYNSINYSVFDRNRHNVLGIGHGNLSENNGWKENFTLGLRIGIKLN